jgi:hypothetical protein
MEAGELQSREEHYENVRIQKMINHLIIRNHEMKNELKTLREWIDRYSLEGQREEQTNFLIHGKIVKSQPF